ncbi:Ferroporti-1 [Epithele typhae]|uniref:Ferroporti-1 n=1 Tax=Epithele typhae TaxID=378194 RepID=UPI002008A297|nr:Ferroporti-1 [Epithele typhae]KAH9932025.1 Ferroporti-1 [Epithele typhae]
MAAVTNTAPDPDGVTPGPVPTVVEVGGQSEQTHLPGPKVDLTALSFLLVQHLSNSWGLRTAEFAVYLFLVILFPDTLLPASIYGFVTTGVAIFLSGWAGRMVDEQNNLAVVRASIIVIKFAAAVQYGASLVLLFRLQVEDSTRPWSTPLASGMFTLVTLGGCVHTIAGTTITVAVEREWVTCIAGDRSAHLTTLNTYMRRIDLFCKLVAPLFVSLLTSVASYRFAAIFLSGVEGACLVFELIWISISYRHFPVLREAQEAKDALKHQRDLASTPGHNKSPIFTLPSLACIRRQLLEALADWKEFTQTPIFLSSLAISWLYVTVLSFDGTMLAYLKAHAYSDPFLAGMRGITVVAGLLGTLVMPVLERRLGLVRAGNWSIWSEVLCLVPVLVVLYVGAPPDGSRAPGWNAALLFGGMMLSRIGLWAFDLCQLKELQLALAAHPRRNSMTALQTALQNVASMFKYVLTIVLSKPSQFKYAALASFVSVFAGASTYLLYVKKERGHVLHHGVGDLIPLLRKKWA